MKYTVGSQVRVIKDRNHAEIDPHVFVVEEAQAIRTKETIQQLVQVTDPDEVLDARWTPHVIPNNPQGLLKHFMDEHYAPMIVFLGSLLHPDLDEDAVDLEQLTQVMSPVQKAVVRALMPTLKEWDQ